MSHTTQLREFSDIFCCSCMCSSPLPSLVWEHHYLLSLLILSFIQYLETPSTQLAAERYKSDENSTFKKLPASLGQDM